jgi:FtsH ternary system domain X5
MTLSSGCVGLVVMSRAYRIEVKESLSRHVQVDDGVCSTLELLPILEKPRMGELLAAELEQRGFKRDGTHVERQQGEVTVRINVETGEVSVTAEGHLDVNVEATRVAMVEVASADREAALRAAAKASLESQADAQEEVLKRKVTAQIEAVLRDVKEELDGVVNRVTGQALKARAAELGTVEEIHEEANGNISIRVRV